MQRSSFCLLLHRPTPSCTTLALDAVFTQAAAFQDEVVDGVVAGGERGGAGLLGLTGTGLALQETHPQVGDHQLVLGSRSERIQLVGGRQSSVDHLEVGGGGGYSHRSNSQSRKHEQVWFYPSWSAKTKKRLFPPKVLLRHHQTGLGHSDPSFQTRQNFELQQTFGRFYSQKQASK